MIASRKRDDALRLLAASASVRLMRGWSHNGQRRCRHCPWGSSPTDIPLLATGQKDVPDNSISLHLASAPRTLAVLTTLSLLVALLLPLSALVRAARPPRRTTSAPRQRPKLTLQHFLLRGVAFGTLAACSFLHVGVLALAHRTLAFEHALLPTPVELARFNYALGALTWVACTLFARLDPIHRPTYHSKLDLTLLTAGIID